jgi:hypothetical protein
MTEEDTTTVQTVPCCPALEPCATCDQLNFSYRLPLQTTSYSWRRQADRAG